MFYVRKKTDKIYDAIPFIIFSLFVLSIFLTVFSHSKFFLYFTWVFLFFDFIYSIYAASHSYMRWLTLITVIFFNFLFKLSCILVLFHPELSFVANHSFSNLLLVFVLVSFIIYILFFFSFLISEFTIEKATHVHAPFYKLIVFSQNINNRIDTLIDNASKKIDFDLERKIELNHLILEAKELKSEFNALPLRERYIHFIRFENKLDILESEFSDFFFESRLS